jgi:hypothetical protein
MTRALLPFAIVFLSVTTTASPPWITLTPEQVAKLTVNKLRIPYPEQARLSRITGEGLLSTPPNFSMLLHSSKPHVITLQRVARISALSRLLTQTD